MMKRHDGGSCPVPPTVVVRPVYRGAEDPVRGIRITLATAARLDWSHDGGPDDIIAYEVGVPPQPAPEDAPC